MGREAQHRSRDTARDIRPKHSPYLGGGTILAARSKHRITTDIDVRLPGRNTLIDLLQDNDRNIVNQLGGTPEAVVGGRVKIAFDRGFLHISAFLSSQQVLCGKLERVDQMLVRYVFDVLTADDEQPAPPRGESIPAETTTYFGSNVP